MTNHFYLEELNACDYLLLDKLEEPKSNSLRLELQEAQTSKVPIPIEIAGQSLGEGFTVAINDRCARFELLWDSYVLYQVTNESYGRQEDSRRGMIEEKVTIFQESPFLDYVMGTTNATHDYPGRLLHFRVICSDHVLDVVTTTEPQYQRIGPGFLVH